MTPKIDKKTFFAFGYATDSVGLYPLSISPYKPYSDTLRLNL